MLKSINRLFASRTQNSRLSSARRRLGVEALEKRELMDAKAEAWFGTLYIDGTNGNDTVRVSNDYWEFLWSSRSCYRVELNGKSIDFDVNWSGIERVVFKGFDGNDRFVNDTILPATADGGNGDDYLATAGPGSLFGGADFDEIHGSTFNDTLNGGSGNDLIYGSPGDDYLIGGTGTDRLFGEDGNDTIVSIDDSTSDVLSGGSGTDSFWIDENYCFWIGPNVRVRDSISDAAFEERDNTHVVQGFTNGADRTPDGDNIADPTDGVNYKRFSGLLFSSRGPSRDDIRQGEVGDCWLLSTLGGVASRSPNTIRQMVADLGDGSYAVRLGGNTYRVDADLPTQSFLWFDYNLKYARRGAEDSLWVPIVEKAYTLYRTRSNTTNQPTSYTYNSLQASPTGTAGEVGGNPTEALNALGAADVSFRPKKNFTDAYAALAFLEQQLSLGRVVTLAMLEPSFGCPCVAKHAYTVVGVKDGYVLLRNPWGSDGPGSDGYVKLAVGHLQDSKWEVEWGTVR